MKVKYVIVRCPECGSVSQLKATGVRTNMFTCPVCLDGEIKYQEQPSPVYKIGANHRVELPALVAV